MLYCAALSKAYPSLGPPSQTALLYGEISPDWYNTLSDEDRFLLDYLTLAEFNQKQIEAMKEDNKKREEEKAYPGIASKLPMDEIKARLAERQRRFQGEY